MAAEHAWLEVPVFIHGITPEYDPQGHNAEYEALFGLVQQELVKVGKPPFTVQPVEVEWGWRSKQTQSFDENLATVEHWLAQMVIEIEKATPKFDFSINPLRAARPLVRQFFFYGFADMFYYVSADGESTVRGRVFKHLSNELLRIASQARQQISLTLFTHSGGTVIAHDWLYHLHRSDKVEQAKAREEFTQNTLNSVVLLRDLAQRGALRIRRFYTMGSPIAPLALRSNALIERFLKKALLRPRDIGLGARDELPGPRWLNFIDEDDLAAHPVAFMYDTSEGPLVKDEYVDVGDLITSAHTRYWWSRALARRIAQNW